MNEISREELKAKLEQGDDFKLVMVLSDWAYRAKHIPQSLHVSSPEQALDILNPDDDVVLYCSNPSCVASQYAYQVLVSKGFSHVWRYSGGLEDWDAAGYPLEGEMVETLQT